jgi:hypothetical protein
MTIFPKEFPTNIPRILAGFIGLNFGTYYMTALIVEMKIGRPSSTSAIGFVFIPIYILILMSLCYLAALVITSFAGWDNAAREESRQRPRVLFNTGQVKLISNPIQIKDKVEGNLVLSIYEEDNEKIRPVVWNGKEVKFDREGNILKIERINGGELVPADLREFDYIGRVYAVPVNMAGTDRQALGVVVRLRPTSKRAIFLVYDSAGKLVYQELLECHGLKGLISLIRDMAGREYLSFESEPRKTYSVDQVDQSYAR